MPHLESIFRCKFVLNRPIHPPSRRHQGPFRSPACGKVATARRATSLPGVGRSSDLTPGSTHLGHISIGCICPGGVLGRGMWILRGPGRRWSDLVHRRCSGARGGGGRDRRLLRDVAAVRGTRLSACGRAELSYDGTTSVVAAVWGLQRWRPNWAWWRGQLRAPSDMSAGSPGKAATVSTGRPLSCMG
jgi:hypothetical protein